MKIILRLEGRGWALTTLWPPVETARPSNLNTDFSRFQMHIENISFYDNYENQSTEATFFYRVVGEETFPR